MKNYNNNVLQDVDKKQERGKFNEKNYCISNDNRTLFDEFPGGFRKWSEL